MLSVVAIIIKTFGAVLNDDHEIYYVTHDSTISGV